MSTERETLENAFDDIGDVSGLTVFDAGPEGVVARYLAERIGDGRIIGVNIWLEAYGKVREKVGDELMDKVVFIKGDMQHMDYLKDDFFDLIISYDTLISIEVMTPGGTLPILRQFYRILKHGKWFLAIEHPPSEEVKPVNKAQELNIRFEEILDQIRPKKRRIVYTARQLSQMLKRIGFADIRWKTVSEGICFTSNEVTEMMRALRNLAIERIRDRKEEESILRQIKDLACKIKKSGLQSMPYYALYAKKS